MVQQLIMVTQQVGVLVDSVRKRKMQKGNNHKPDNYTVNINKKNRIQ